MRKILLLTIMFIAFAWSSPVRAQSDTRAIGKQYFDMGEYFRWANAIDGNGDLVKAVASYKKAADINYPDGIAAMGEMTEFGLGGVPKDEKKAFSLYKKAYDLGSGRACYCLARCHAYGIACEVDYKKMIALLQTGIERGDRTSIYGMGEMLYKGWGTEQSYEKAITYFEKASAMGCASSKYYLGICYRNGYGVVKDEKKGLDYLKQSAIIYSYADKELKRAQPETVAAKGSKGSDTPLSFVKTEHSVAPEVLAGEWTGYLSYYDWSGKTKLNEHAVKLTIKTSGAQINGTWEQDDAKFSISGFNNQYGIVFNSGEYDGIDHYMGKVRLKINTGTFKSFSDSSRTYLAGNISIFSITEKAPERPTYILLSRATPKEEEVKPKEPSLVDQQVQKPVAAAPAGNTSPQTQPSIQQKQQGQVAEKTEKKSIVESVRDNLIKSRVWPMPFNNQINVEYNLIASGNVEIRLVAISGNLIGILAKERRQAGLQTQSFEVSVNPGVYVVQIVSGEMRASHVIIKK